jgi:DNA-binding transcriptional LysR family regulator
MELRHLRYFVAVAEELHFRRAADRLHVAQPAVSEQVRKLEQELGVRLLDRTPRSVSLTEVGAAFLTEARLVLKQAEVARQATRTARDRAAARLRVGYVTTALPASVPRALQRLTTPFGKLEASVERGATSELIEAVRAERLDIAIVPLPAPTAGLRITALGDQRPVAALPIGHRGAANATLRLERMAPERVVVLPREANRPFYDAVLATCHRAGVSPTLVEMPEGHVESALLAVASGAGMALVPEVVAERYLAPGVRFLPLEGELPTITTAAVTRQDCAHMPTESFLHVVGKAGRPRGIAAENTTTTRAA